jgi:hypothetical protein
VEKIDLSLLKLLLMRAAVSDYSFKTLKCISRGLMDKLLGFRPLRLAVNGLPNKRWSGSFPRTNVGILAAISIACVFALCCAHKVAFQ